MKTISWGNPYTHEEHERTSYNNRKGELPDAHCSWCGQPRTTLYQYDRTKGHFCNKQCYRDYYDK